MKVAFYTKLIIAFLLFATVLLSFFFYMSKGFHKEQYLELANKKLNAAIEYKKSIFKRTIDLNSKRLTAFSQSTAYKNFIDLNHRDELIDMFKTVISSDERLLGIKIVDESSKEVLSVQKHEGNLNVQYNNKIPSYLQKEDFYGLLSLKNREIGHSTIKLDYQKGELIHPLQPILETAIKVNHHYIILSSDAKVLLTQSLKIQGYTIDIFDAKGNFILHGQELHNWSKYFYPKIDIESYYPRNFQKILDYKQFITNEYISSKIYLDEKQYIIVLVKLKSTLMDDFGKNNYIIGIITLMISIVLALIMSNPIANMNKKLEKEKDRLNVSVLENSLLLDDSLKLIDKYVMYIKFDHNRVILDASTLLCETSGFSKQELIGQDYKILLHQDSDFDSIFKIISSGEIYSGEVKNIKKFGEEYWVRSNYEPHYDETNTIVSFTEIRNNISNRKKVQKLYDDLNNQIEQLNAVFQNANSGIALLSYEGKLQNANRAFCHLLGFSNAELMQKNIFSLVLESRNEFFNLMLKQAKEFGTMSNIEVIFLSKNHDYIHLDVSFSVLPNKDSIVLVANSLEDKRKLQELNVTLEQKVNEEVSKNIKQAKDHQEEQIKNAKLTSIGTLAAGITHEINTPLTYLKGNFEMMQYDIQALPNSVQKTNMSEDAQKITEAINRIANIVESMREMSQSSTEAKEKTNIYATLVTSLTMAYNMSKQVSKIYLNGKLFEINSINKNEFEFFAQVQKQRIEQVWVIIINNALDELKKIDDYEKRLLNIMITQEEDEVIVTFKDNAGGIKDEIIENLFEPFVSSKQHSGMGVGLNIAKKIVDDQEAVIEAYNEDDGAVFQIRLKSKT